MEVIQEQDINGRYVAELNLTPEQWDDTLSDKTICPLETLLALLAFYYSPKRENTCVGASKLFGRSYGFYNINVSSVGKRIQKKYDFQILGLDHKPTYWSTVMGSGRGVSKKEDTEGSFLWQLRPEVVNYLQRMVINDALEKYIADFSNNWPKEKYKWEALKTFQDNWDIEAPDFSDMLQRSLDKVDNLLENRWDWPAPFLKDAVKVYPEDVRAMFRVLFSEDGSVAERAEKFMSMAETLYDKVKTLDDFSAYKESYQKIGPISVYLWLRFPEKYSIYKYTEYSNFSKKLGLDAKVALKTNGETLVENWKAMDILHDVVSSCPQAQALMNERIAEDPTTFAQDPNLKTLAQDFGFWVSRYYEPLMGGKFESSRKPNYWIARITDDTKWEEALTNGYWCTQQRYEHQKKSAVTNLLNIVKQVQEGDILLLTYGREICAYGVVKDAPFETAQMSNLDQTIQDNENEFDSGIVRFSDSNVFYEDLNEGTENWGQRLYVGEWLCYSDPTNVTTKDTSNAVTSGVVMMSLYGINEAIGEKKVEELIKQYEEKHPMITKITKLLRQKKNVILQGAPGTGKTYTTAAAALSVLGIDSVDLDNHTEVMEKYDELIEAGQICFTTFHQSMDYESFVEGLTPVPSENGGVTYEVEDGIFKQICLSAQATSKDNFEESYSKFTQDISDQDAPYELTTPSGKTFHVTLNGNGNLNLLTGKDKNHNGVLTKSELKRIAEGQSTGDGWKGYFQGVLKCLADKYGFKSEKKEKSDYVLIIDEINRGNVSKIFGELITLLEADKRSGSEHKITLVLPYSKKRFSVPSNLYIIGTMNTTDRSTGTIDYAIRRRFAFVTLPADEKVIQSEGPARSIFENVRKFISEHQFSDMSLDDLMVGHSYFMAKDEEELAMKIEYEVIPLVKEYVKDGILQITADEAQKYYDAWLRLETVENPAADEDSDSQA